MLFDIFKEIQMKSADLHTIWSAPDNSRLTSKQFSFRLPTHVAAKIQALCDMYPAKNRTQIVADLLAAALHEVELAYPEVRGPQIGQDNDGSFLYEDVGISARYRALADKYYLELEKEQGNEEAKPLYGGPSVMCVMMERDEDGGWYER